MMKALILGVCAALLICQGHAVAEDGAAKRDLDPNLYNLETGLPYGNVNDGVVNHQALRRRALTLLEKSFGLFRSRSVALHEQALSVCSAPAINSAAVDFSPMRAAFKAAYLAWAPLDSYQFGPIEARGAALSVNFWPDKKNFVGRGLRSLMAEPPEKRRLAATVHKHSAAVQGFPALERLLFDQNPDCPAIIGVSAHIAMMAEQLYNDWFDDEGWAALARAAGPDNPVYLSAEEFTKTLYTAVDFGLFRIAEARLSRPLGDFRRSYPKRAEAWRSGLSLALIEAQLQGVADMIEFGFAGDVFEPNRAWVLRVVAQSRARIGRIGAPLHEAVSDPQMRIRAEALQTKIRYLQLQIAQDVGPGLGVDTGFSAADGD